MGLFNKIFGDDEEKGHEEEARRKAAEAYAEKHAHGAEEEHEHEHAHAATKTAAKTTTAKKAAAAPAKKAAATKAAPAKKAAAKAEKAEPHTHEHGDDPKPSHQTYAPLAGAPAAHAHTHVHDVAEGPVTAAHDQMMTIHVETHVPDHAPREDDPHYHLFEQAKARLKRQGLWKCIINDELCGGEAELHHTYIEFSQINEVDPKRVQEALGLHFDNDEEFQVWAESPGNLEVLCANHHRTHYGIHVIPGPLWEALRFRMVGTKAAAEFVTADEAAKEAKEAS
jgi:hypothetical protein